MIYEISTIYGNGGGNRLYRHVWIFSWSTRMA